MHAFLHSPRANAGVKKYKCGRTQPLLRMSHDHGKLAVETQILIIIMIHTIHNHYYNNQPLP